ncbi:hypothetical protein [Roseibium sp.]|uniref:hypothetical protein n=1 Tax=Roseibium sp. TaxID=1936156 RepID=UPI003A96E780
MVQQGRCHHNRHGAVEKVLAYDIVEVIDGGEGTSFHKLPLATGGTGFVDKAHLRSAVDYRPADTSRSFKDTVRRDFPRHA